MWKSVDSVDLTGREPSEDRFGTRGALAWMLDGATSVAPGKVTAFETDGLWLVDRLDQALYTLADHAVPLGELVAEALRKVRDRAGDEWTGTPEVPPSAALGIVRYSGSCVEFLVLAD